VKTLPVAFALLLCAAPLAAHERTSVTIADLDRRIAARPLDAGLRMQRGEMHRMAGDRDRARRDYELSLRLDPGLTAVHLCEGRLWMDEGLPARALPALDRYIASHPADPAGRMVRARALALLGRHADAAAEFARVIALEDSAKRLPQPDLYLESARALIAADGGNRPAALELLEDGLRRLSRPVALEVEALAIEQSLGRTDAALARLDRLLGAAARKESFLVRRAEILEQAGRLAEAERSWREASSALDRLPESRRNSPALVAMKQTVAAALKRLPLQAPAAAEGAP